MHRKRNNTTCDLQILSLHLMTAQQMYIKQVIKEASIKEGFWLSQ
jgi:hypothetical protein